MYLPHILVVGDGRGAGASQIESLLRAGFAVSRVDTVYSAMAACSECVYDAIVINDFLADIDAADLCRKLRESQPSAAIVVQCDARSLDRFYGAVESVLVFPANETELETTLLGSIVRRKLRRHLKVESVNEEQNQTQ